MRIAALIITALLLTACSDFKELDSLPESYTATVTVSVQDQLPDSLDSKETESKTVDHTEHTHISDRDSIEFGTLVERDMIVDNVLHSEQQGEIHFSCYIPDSYDGSKPYALFVTLPSWEGLYFQGVGKNLGESFPFEARQYNDEMIIISTQLDDWGETSANMAITLTEYFLAHYSIDPDRVYLHGFSGSVDELHAFYKDFENHLMPAVEGRFHTYAESTSYDDLKASRNHRAFGGFSLGSVTTWLQLCYNSDYIRYYLPMSGSCWYYGGYGDFQIEKNVDFIEQLVKDNELNERGYFIYHGVGTNDTVKSQSVDMAAEMLSRSDLFTPEHYVFYQREGGQHDHISCREFMYNALPLFFEDGDNKVSAAKTSADVTLDTTVGEVKRIAAFDDFGRLLFPVDRAVSDNMSLEDITSSNTYVWYNYLDPDKTVEIVNDMKNRAESGQQIFYSIYSEEEIAKDSSLADTGLFFFKGTPGEKFAVINAGGGFVYVGAMHDSFPHALELSKMGYNAFALIYRHNYAYDDLARAIAFITQNADTLEVDPEGFSLWGGSAGARMAAALGNADNANAYGIPQASAVIMQYTGYSYASAYDAPTYANVGTSDGIASWQTMQSRLKTLESYGIPTEFHSFEGLPHGFGLGTGSAAEGWINDAVDFWESQL